MMKICHATNYFPECHKIWGGAELACYRILRLLGKAGYEVNVLFTRPIKRPEDNFNFFPIRIWENYFGRKIGRYFKVAKLLGIPFDPFSFIHSYKIFNRMKPDILHLHNFNILSFSLVHSAKLLKIPTVVTIYDYWPICPNAMLLTDRGNVCMKFHGLYCIGCLRNRGFKYLKNAFLIFRKEIFNFFLDKIDSFIVLSESSSNILQRYGIDKSKIRVIRQTFSFEDLDSEGSIEIEKSSILYVGWVEYRKGLHAVIEAMPYILKEDPKAKLYVVGELTEKEYEDKLRHLINKHQLSEKVFFLGKMKHQRVKKLLQKAQVVVVPEQWENMSPVVLVEAMAQAKPIVASRIGGIPEFIKEGRNGLLADPKDSLEFAKKIIYMLKNEEETKIMGSKAREDIARICDEDRVLNELLQLYKSLLVRK